MQFQGIGHMLSKDSGSSPNTLICVRNGTLTLESLMERVPCSIYYSKTHVEVCVLLAGQRYAKSNLLQVYVNLLVSH